MTIRQYINRRSVSRLVGTELANRIADRFTSRRADLPPTDVFAFYAFLDGTGFGEPLSPRSMPERNTINWFVPPIGRGSGGHLNIFRFVRNLEELGFVSRIIVCDPHNQAPPSEIKANIDAWFMPIKASVHIHPQGDIPPAYTAIATGWQTAYPVRDFRSTVNRAYFVQDFEPYFYSMGSEYAFAENTYRFGLAGITAGSWLKNKLADEYGMRTRAFGFSYDRDLYSPRKRRASERRHIFVYARPVTARRGFELSMLALKKVTDQLPDLGVIFAGWDVGGYTIPFVHHNGGSVALDELPDLYSQCDAALVVSMTNLSLLPLELMACGCPLVSNRGPNVEWLLDADNAELADPTPESLAQGMLRLLQDEERRQAVIANGLAVSAATDWKKEAGTVAKFLQELTV